MSKISAMARIAADTDAGGGSRFPRFMLENFKSWQREGLVTLEKASDRDDLPSIAKITEKGRNLAKKAMSSQPSHKARS